MDFCVGCRVLVNSKHKALIRYIGPTSFAEGTWYGLELEREIGKHEGTVLGVTYFTTPKKRGTFVKRENLSLYEQVAATAQAGSRLTATRGSMQKDVSWRAFNALDADDEAQMLARRSRLMATTLGAALTRERPQPEQIDVWERDAAAMAVDPSYTGPHLTFPLTADQCLEMGDKFRAGGGLHYKYALQLVAAYRRWAAALPTLVEVAVLPGERLTVCGDTHGQLSDLCSVFALNGVPSPTNRYLWNGDFVDRGDNGCEILFLLMAWCLTYPGAGAPGADRCMGLACMVNRGNHETHAQNVTGGFMMEVLNKYSGPVAPVGGAGSRTSGGGMAMDLQADAGLRLYDSIQAAFDCMPLATLISTAATPAAARAGGGSAGGSGSGAAAAPEDNKRVFVVHGGLLQRPGVTLAQIAAVQRKREIPYGQPAFEDKLFEDLMWSDPRVMTNTAPSDRGAGVFFGADVTQRFCALNGVSLVIRSHECVPDGFLFTHDNRLVTIFSASRYCGRGTNRGAFVTFEDDLRYTMTQFSASAMSAATPALLPLPIGSPLPDLLALQFDASSPIFRAPLLPAGMDGSAPSPRAEEPSPATPSTRPSAADAAAHAAQEEAVRLMLMERICLRKSDLYFFFSTADRGAGGSRDGCVSPSVWADGMRSVLNLDLPWLTLCPMLAEAEADGRINYSRFLDRYRIAVRPGDLAWMEAITERVCSGLFNACSSLEASFRALDEDGSGVIEFNELERGLTRMNLGLNRSQIYEIMSALDSDRDGRIQFSEFAGRFKLVFSRMADENVPGATGAAGSGSAGSAAGGAAAAAAAASTAAASGTRAATELDAWSQSALEKVGRALFKGGFGTTAPAVFASIDADGNGLLSPEEFQGALQRLELGFTPAEMGRITSLVDANSSGSINYLEFVTAFRVSDVSSPPLHTQVSTWTPGIAAVGSSDAFTPVGAAGAAAGSTTLLASSPTASAAPSFFSPSASSTPSGAVSASWQRGVIEKVIGVLYEYRVELGAAFSMFDTDRSGKISASEFREGLQALTCLTGSPLTDMQADEVLRALDTNGDGEIDWAEFVGAFRLVDTAAGGAAATSSGASLLSASGAAAVSVAAGGGGGM